MTAHAKLGASSADRWMTCPGSVALSEGLPDPESPHAREGSAAHALGETCLLNGEEPFEYLGEPAPQEEFADITVSDDMVDAVSIYVQHIRSYGRKIKPDMIERRVSLEQYGDWAKGMFGTADFIFFDGRTKTLHVDDYKHGMGVAVEVEGNPQLKYYAAAALMTLTLLNRAEKVRCTIIQPRKPHEDGPIRSVEYTVGELLDWVDKTLKPAVLATHEAGAPLQPSEKGCKFCRAKGVCPALMDKALDDALMDFTPDGIVQPRKKLDKLTPDDISRILSNEKAIKDWLAGVATLAQESLLHGQDITGGAYKLVTGRSSRSWRDEDAAVGILQKLGFTEDDIFTQKFLTPAQAEKLVGKAGKAELADLVVKEDGKPTLAPADDKRPALLCGPESDFADHK